MKWDFPDDSVAKTPRSQCRGLISGQETRTQLKIKDPA